MLPPTSPQNPQPLFNGQTASSRPSIPLPPSFTGARDLPALPTSRSESSMSISSMLGSDAVPPCKDPLTTHRNGAASSMNGSIPSPTHANITASSPSRRTFGQGLFRRRSPSPVDQHSAQGIQNRPFRAFSNESHRNQNPSVPQSSSRAPSFGLSPRETTQQSPTEARPGQQWKFSHHRRLSSGRITKRPTSQPSGSEASDATSNTMQQPRSTLSISERWKDLQIAEKYGKQAPGAKERSHYGPAERPSQAFLEEHIRKVREERAAALATSKLQSPGSPKRRPLTSAGSRPSISTDFVNNRFRSDIENVEHVYNRDPKDVPATVHSPFSPDSLRRSREERLAANGPQQSVTSQPSLTRSQFQERLEERHRQHFPPSAQPAVQDMDRSVSTGGIDSHTKTGEEHTIPHARHSLSLLLENGKRGRVSPLPQAVQGAQSRNSGPASDPGIKNEFGRMFSGIGSGVGSSGPMGSGASTPFLGSPKASHEPERRTPFAGRGELMELSRPRPRSKMGRVRLANDENPRMEVDNINKPSSIGASAARGIKRRHGHHHHPHSHRQPSPSSPRRSRGYGAQLAGVATHPRQHLGTTTYSPTLESAHSTASQPSANKLGFSSVPSPLPRFEGKENCTFTVRIPRFYLSELEREEVTRRRALWGCDVYTDDSDPLAAAIHSGWVQGSWGDGIDISMLEYSKSNPRPTGKTTVIDLDEASSAGKMALTSPPSTPTSPPVDRDLHLTCLVLPPLEKYTSKIRHGIKSREWGNNHDGMSFRVERVEWIDDRVAKGEGRTGEARRKRLKTLLDERKGLGRSVLNPVVRISGGPGELRGKGQDVVMVGA
ncbi:MAG: hypothetical protein Q9213_001119 [Squamulea squamosa]